MVSPYLLQPLRSYEEVALNEEARRAPPPIDDETVVRRAFFKAKREGRGPLAQIDRALTAVLAKNPDMAPLEALRLVNRVRQEAGDAAPARSVR